MMERPKSVALQLSPQSNLHGATPTDTVFLAASTPPREEDFVGPPRRSTDRASMRHSIQSYIAAEDLDEPAKPKFFSRATLMKVVYFLSDVVYSLALLGCGVLRANGISSMYLFGWVLGTMYTFKSRVLSVFTLLVSACAIAGHIYAAVSFTKTSSPHILFGLFGFASRDDAWDITLNAGPDVLMFLISILQVYVVQKQIRTALPVATLQAAAASVRGDDGMSAQDARSNVRWRENVLGASEFFVFAALFVAAFATTGFVSFVYYLFLLQRLAAWTLFPKALSLQELEDGASHYRPFFGAKTIRLLLAYSILVIAICQAYQFPDVHNSSIGPDLGNYTGLFVMPGTSADWSGYVFYATQCVLFIAVARTLPNYAKWQAARNALPQTNEASSPSHRSSSHASFYSAHESPLDSATSNRPVQELLSHEPFFVRLFLEERGILWATLAAIFWSVSYPSYMNAGLLAIALVLLATFGLVLPRKLLVFLNVYAFGVSIATVVFLLPLDWPSKLTTLSNLHMIQIGIATSEFPLLDLSVQHLCVLVICCCVRVRLQYQYIVKEVRVERELHDLQHAPSVYDDMMASGTQTPGHAIPVHENLQLHRMRSVEVTKLWIKDAQSIFIASLDMTVLFTIFVTVLSTSVTILQTGYLALATFLSVFQRFRRQLWRALLVYALVVCLAMYSWNVVCPQSVDKTRFDTIGLTCFKTYPRSNWAALWPTLFSAQLFLIFQVVLQLCIYLRTDNGADERARMLAQANRRPIYFVSRLAREVDHIFRVLGIAVAYIGFVVVAFVYEVNDAGHVTLVGLIQVLLLFTLLGSHLSTVVQCPRGNSLKTQRQWRLVLAYEAFVLVTRYLYQFQGIASWVQGQWPDSASRVISIRDVGYVQYASTERLSGLFMYLFPTACLAGLVTWNLASMRKKLHNYDVLVRGRSNWMDSFCTFLELCQRMVYFNSPIVLLVVNMAIVCSNISAFNITYLGVLIVTLGRPQWTHCWKPIFWLSSVFTLCLYAFQFEAFQPAKLEVFVGGHAADAFEHSAVWFGLARIATSATNRTVTESITAAAASSDSWNAGDATYPSMWALTGEHMLVLLLCIITRVSHFWDPLKDVPAPAVKRQSSLASEPWAPVGMADETPFLESLQSFLVRFTSEGSVILTMLLLLVSSFIHRNIISVVYMLVVRAIMVASPLTVCIRWYLIAGLVVFVCVSQYFIMLWVPPFLNWQRESLPPWTWCTPAYEYFFALHYQHRWALFCDYLVLLVTFMIPAAKPYYLAKHGKNLGDTPRQDISLLEPAEAKGDEDYTPIVVQPGYDVDDFTVTNAANTTLWQLCLFVVMNFWIFALLIVVFITGCVRSGIASGIYLGFSIYMLLHVQRVGSPGDKLLRWLRDFTWFYMFASILFQLPFFTDKTVTCALGTNDPQDGVCLSIPSIFDLNKYPVSYPGAPPYFASLPVLSVVIFWMINIQELIFQSPLYAYIHAHTQREEDLSDLRRSRLTDAILKERLVRWTALKQDKAAAIVRLKSIVSRLVNKVEEMMDIAMGLNYSLPPSAPEKPFVQPDEATQNSITLHWKAPEAPIHRIRAYKVTRQMYPTSTLLGDYSDPIEVAASAGTSLVVEGLRPGAAYQFKVAAISRMGEGPFSAPSEPARTISLNWGGSCLAGWVHYTKAALPKRWYASLWSPKPIVRYIVVDTHAFVWYKSENVALKHRSTKKRKRMKTSFLMRNVLSMDLSEEPIRLDDNSSPIHTLDVVATLRNSNAEVQYSFHLERADDFDKWAAALGQMLPRDVLSDRFLAYLELHGLPMPLEADENDEDEVEDGAKNAGGSEWSSVTGDESWLGDAEDEEMAKRPTYGWIWLKIYQALYNAQDAALRQEHQLYEDDDEILPSFLETLFVLINAIRSHSRDICCLTFMCSFMFQGDLLNAFYVLATFGFVLLENPRPHSGAWHFFLVYSFVVVSLRYSFQLPFFCQQFTKKNVLYPSIQPFCPTDLSVFTSGQLNPIQPMVIFGLYKFDGTANPHVDTMLRGVAWNFIVILAILFHRRELQLRGMWYAGVSSEAADEKNPQQSIMGRQSTRMSTRRGSNLSVDSLDLDDYEVADFLARHEQAKRATEPTELPRRRVLPKSQRVAFQDSDSPRSLDAELDATADEANDASPPLAPTSPQHAQAQQLVVAPLPSASAPEPEHRSLVKKNKALEWCKARLPSGVVQFCRRVISPAPEHWDRNINKAITGVKPGRDYYLLLLFLPLVSIVYVILLFQYFGEPNTSSDSFSLQLSDSMLNGYMVLIVFCELVVMIWDRAAYVYGSMISKMVLHFVFLLAVHIGLWILLPMYSQSYFQTRLGLQGLYLLQCFYLWTSAQQLKYGYLVFRGHHFVKKPGADVTASMLVIEKCFKIYYAVPFAFEIRCLLDWICSTTALDMEMWFLLEEIAAEMYLVRQEMNGRIDNADFLQGNKRQPLFFKLLKGGILLLLLLVCVIGPLAIFSTANPSTSANPITATTVSFGLQQLDGTVQQLYTSGDTNSPAYAGLQITSTDTATQKIAFASYSQNIWTSTPPMRRNLVAQINSTEPIKWLLSLTFTRSGPDGKQTVSLTFDQMMTPAHRTQFISVLLADGSTADPVKGNSSSNVTGLSPHSGASIAVDADTITAPPIVIAQFYTPVLKVGATSDPVARGSFVKRSILLQRNSEDGVSWWAVSSPDDVAYGSLDVGDAARVSCADPLSPMKDGLCLVTVSDNIVNGLTSLGIGTYGITAAYIFVIFTIGGFVKDAFRGELYKVLYKELPNPNELLELVEGVYIARKEDYLGHLKDEGRLYETLIRVLRSPETLLKVTGPNVIHIPVPKDKID